MKEARDRIASNVTADAGGAAEVWMAIDAEDASNVTYGT